ncbi:MAG: sigma-70 family RNA polymerase sigma factor [Bacteroidales bacterium]|nr:sigma-70 family RNA polymerase sigma factor [Bacteroidales bacterium]
MTDDKRIMELYRSGERNQAFNLIVREYGEQLYWHIRKLVASHDDANDLLQNTYVKAWNSLETFREDSRLYTWLYRIATNEVLTFLNRKKIIGFLSLSAHEAVLERKLAADENFNGTKVQLSLQKAVAKLPPKQKVVFSMRYWEEMKYEDMAEVLDTSAGSLKASYHHAYQKVVDYLKKDLDIEN